ncbi:MAG: DUF945 family protein [Burkholderiaceae bacterium]
MFGKIAMTAGAVAVALVGASYAGSARTERAIAEMVAGAPAHGQLHVSVPRHERGLFASSGSVNLAFDPGCGRSRHGAEPLTARIDYKASHLPGLAGLGRFEAELVATGALAKQVERFVGSARIAHASGTMGFGGTVNAHWQTSEAQLAAKDGTEIRVPASDASMTIDEKTMKLDWRLPAVTVNGSRVPLRVSGTRLQLDMSDRRVGLGSMRFGVGRIEVGEAVLQDFEASSDTVSNGDRIDAVSRYRVASVAAAGKQWRDIGVEFAARGLDSASLVAISSLLSGRCDLNSLSRDQQQSLRAALRTLLERGVSIGLPAVRASAPDGSLNASLALRVDPGPTERFSLEQNLHAAMSIEMAATWLPPRQREALIRQGFARLDGDRLSASLRYEAGRLEINGRPDTRQSAALVTGILSGVDRQLRAQQRPSG